MSFHWGVECCGGGLCDGEDEVRDEIDVRSGDKAFCGFSVLLEWHMVLFFFIGGGSAWSIDL